MNTLKFGNSEWYGTEGNILAYNDENGNFKPLPFDFSRGSIATRVNKQGLIETVGANDARVDYKDNANGALLLEPSRANYLLQSNQFDTTWAATNATVLGSQSGIYGSSDAWKLSENTANSVHILLQNTTSVSNYTFSIYLKKGTKNKAMLFDGTNNNGAKFNLETQSLHSYYDNAIDYKIEILSDGWARYSISLSTTSSSFRVYMLDDNYNLAYEGNIENYIYIQQAQVEEGSYATSYIPTQGTAQTRLADVCNNSANDQVINSTEGVLYLEAKVKTDTAFAANCIAVSDGTDANRLSIIMYGNINSIRASMNVGSVSQFDFNLPSGYSQEQYYKIAVSYKVNDCKIFINGTKILTDTSATMPSIGTFDRLNLDLGQGLYDFYGNVKDVKIYNTSLSDSELAALTQV